ncbi:hypothetical protein EsDP_00002102 [Epichloe bromicola]|uniref:Uncharacterized protein n=1 Tax=Epichloe bromicola TaxID=79588 RepID=A0ABQ0CJU0_9HYPO
MTGIKFQPERVECIGNWLANVSATSKRAYADQHENKGTHADAFHRIPTPESQNLSPSKKRRVAQDENDDCDGENDASDDDNVQTPRSQRIPLRASQRSLPPLSTSSTRLSRRSSRRGSPVKKKQALIGLEKPVLLNELYAPKDQLPSDVQMLYQRIRNIAYYHSDYLPLEDRANISSAVGEEIPDCSFKKAIEGNVTGAASSDFNTLQEILFDSHECQKLGRSKLSLNMLVHAPLLKLALKSHH